MAWIKVKAQDHLATSEVTAGERTATRVFIAISDTSTTTIAAETASHGGTSIPAPNDSHPDDASRRVKSIKPKAEEESNRKIFRIEVNYASKASGGGAPTPAEDPRSRPAECEWSFSDGTEAYFLDHSSDGDKPVVNSAGERFEDLLERDNGAISCTITKNIAASAYSPADAINLKDTINDAAITVDGESIDQYQAKLKGWSCGPVQYENGYAYRVSKVVLEFRETWSQIVEDRGYNEKDSENPTVPKPIIKSKISPNPVDFPWPLDGAGVSLPNRDSTPYTIEFFPYFSTNFGPLPLS